MASLKEIKARINSVSSTLKITQAMKMVSSAKLRRVQKLYTSLEVYLRNLEEIASAAGVSCGCAGSGAGAAKTIAFGAGVASGGCYVSESTAGSADILAPEVGGKVAIVVFSSDTSLCGSYNANIFKALQSRVAQIAASGACAEIIPVGEKVAKMAAKVYGSLCTDFVSAAEDQTYGGIAPLLEFLLEGYTGGRYSSVELLYMHFYTISRQKIECHTYLGALEASGFAVANAAASGTVVSVASESSASRPAFEISAAKQGSSANVLNAADLGAAACTADEMLVILEPSSAEIAAGISDLMLRARLYDALLSAKLSEHACRMVAMQTASDNAEDLLSELRLTFNKQRQQDITEELSDISNGKM